MKTIIKNQSGRSMVEMLGVLAIIGVLSVGGIAGYSAAMSKYRTNQAIEDVQLVMTEVRTLFSSQGNYAGVEDLGAAWIVSIAGDAPFGAITLEPAPNGDTGDTDGAFYLTMADVPSDSCVIMATSDWGDTSTGLLSLATGAKGSGTGIFPATGSGETLVGNASGACTADETILTWTFE